MAEMTVNANGSLADFRSQEALFRWINGVIKAVTNTVKLWNALLCGGMEPNMASQTVKRSYASKKTRRRDNLHKFNKRRMRATQTRKI